MRVLVPGKVKPRLNDFAIAYSEHRSELWRLRRSRDNSFAQLLPMAGAVKVPSVRLHIFLFWLAFIHSYRLSTNLVVDKLLNFTLNTGALTM